MMWYKNSYRRHLCDMHIADWDESFLSRFSPEEYVENLKTAKIQNAMLYLQSHAGLCYYPTQSGLMHRSFRGREDAMRRTAELCRQNGILVTGYYSLNYNTAEHDRHPAWRMLQKNQKSKRENSQRGELDEKAQPFASPQSGRYGLCCPNNSDYRSFVYRQIDEMLAYFELDGMFSICPSGRTPAFAAPVAPDGKTKRAEVFLPKIRRKTAPSICSSCKRSTNGWGNGSPPSQIT